MMALLSLSALLSFQLQHNTHKHLSSKQPVVAPAPPHRVSPRSPSCTSSPPVSCQCACVPFSPHAQLERRPPESESETASTPDSDRPFSSASQSLPLPLGPVNRPRSRLYQSPGSRCASGTNIPNLHQAATKARPSTPKQSSLPSRVPSPASISLALVNLTTSPSRPPPFSFL